MSRIGALFLISAWLALPQAASAQSPFRDWLTDWKGHVALYGSTTADYMSTRNAISRGYVELNPVLGQARSRQAALMYGSALGIDLFSRWMETKEAPFNYIGSIFRWSMIGGHTTAAYFNTRLIVQDMKAPAAPFEPMPPVAPPEPMPAVVPLGGPPLSIPGAN